MQIYKRSLSTSVWLRLLNNVHRRACWLLLELRLRLRLPGAGRRQCARRRCARRRTRARRRRARRRRLLHRQDLGFRRRVLLALQHLGLLRVRQGGQVVQVAVQLRQVLRALVDLQVARSP